MRYILTKGLDNNPLARNIRTEVFVDEQGFKEEFDDIDAEAFHAVIFVKGKAAATGRLFGNPSGCMRIGRVAVIKEYRGMSLGSMVIAVLERKAVALGCAKAELSSQVRVKGFYEELGYKCEGEEYQDQFCPHIKMTKNLV